MADKQRNIPKVTNLRESLVQREAEICLIQQTLSEVLTDLDLETVLDKVASRARELVDAETLLIPILSDDQDFYTYRAGAGPRVKDIIGETMPINYGVCGWVEVTYTGPIYAVVSLEGDGTMGGSFGADYWPATYSTGIVGPIPEPATFALLGLGALALLRRRK